MVPAGIGITLFLPKLPLFYNWHLPSNFTVRLCVLEMEIFLLAIPDAYIFPVWWLNWPSFYTLLLTAELQLRLYFRILNETKDQSMMSLKGLSLIQLIMSRLNGAFPTVLVTYMATISTFILFCLYGSLNQKENFFVFLFLLYHVIVFVPIMYALLLPLVYRTFIDQTVVPGTMISVRCKATG